MATRKIADLAQATTANDADLMVIQDTAATKKVTFAVLLASIKQKLGIGTAASLTTSSKEIVGAINELNSDLSVKSTNKLTDLNNAPIGFKVYIFQDLASAIVAGETATYMVLSSRDANYGIQQFFSTSGTTTWGVMRWRRADGSGNWSAFASNKL